MSKKAILVVSFGSTVDSARETLTKIENRISSDYPEHEVFHAYTSGMIRKRLLEKGISVEGPKEVFELLIEAGFEEVIVQPTHLIPGVEYDRLKELPDLYGERISVELRSPMIYNKDSLLLATQRLNEHWNFDKLKAEDTALLFMGHGTDHLANFIYPAMQTAFLYQGFANVFMATVEGWPSLADTMQLMKRSGYKKVLVAPFMLIAGVHAYEDMAGEKEESWKNQLLKNGFDVTCSMEVVGDYWYK